MLTKDEIAKKEIIKKARELFQRFGYKKTTMDEIAAECGKAKSTLYHYYKNKDDVFRAVIRDEKNILHAKVMEIVDMQPNGIERIKAYFITMLKEINSVANLYRLVKKETTNIISASKLLKELLKEEKTTIIKFHQQVVDEGYYPEINKIDVDSMADFLIAAMLGVINYFVLDDEEFNIEHFENAINIVIDGRFIPQKNNRI